MLRQIEVDEDLTSLAGESVLLLLCEEDGDTA